MATYRLTLLTLILLTLCSAHYAQSLYQQKSINLEVDILRYRIAESPIVHYSETVYADSLLLINGIDYRMDYLGGYLLLYRTPPNSSLQVSYLLIPPSMNSPLQNWEVKAHSDSLFSSIKRKTNPVWGSDTKLEIQGVKTFAITFSDNESFDLKQSLYVNLSGELSKGVFLTAQLSDSESRLSPEGDSKELSSLDKVFIKVYGTNYELAMGDIELNLEGSRYMDYSAKVEGINAWYKSRHSLQAAYSAGSGKSATINLSIVDGKQGPYYLRANDYQAGFIVVAGSEEVYVDGSRWERGMDYSVDYAEGSIMFKRLISSTNQVLVRFHYTDENFPVSSFINSSKLQISDHLSLSHRFIWQQDDKQNPLLYDFSPADKDTLASSGDAQAWGEGATLVSPGQGSYKLFTDSTGQSYYLYAYPDSTADYNVIFSYVGYGLGDYTEFSPGKYRYVGTGLGSWLPKKRLIAPVKQGNLDYSIAYSSSAFNAGIEAIGTFNDKNTLSSKDDKDNYSGIVYAFAELPYSIFKLKAEREQRAADSFLFGKYRNPQLEFDFAGLSSADSLAQSETNLSLSTASSALTSSIMYRYKDIDGLYSQNALRFISSSRQWHILPALNLRSTFSQQDYRDSTQANGQLQYHQADALWTLRSLKLKAEALYNISEQGLYGSSYRKFVPSFSVGNNSTAFAQLSYATDSSGIKNSTWTEASSSQTYALKHMLNTSQHHIDIDFTHRELKQSSSSNPKSNYDLLNLKSSHDFLRKAVNLFLNYQLNQTEFFPKIRELQYIGNGLGLYDSTGVSIADGDYDYVYITSSNGSLSSEINTQLNLYLKPALFSSHPFFKRWHADSSINLNEQSLNNANWKSYLFLPGEVFSEDHTIYGKQTLMQNLWLDIVTNRISANLQMNWDRSLDKRYQSSDRSSHITRTAQLDIKGYNPYNTRITYSNELNRDSRYSSEQINNNFSMLLLRNLAPQTSMQAELAYIREQGNKQDGSEDYTLTAYSLSPGFRSMWMQKYRISGTANISRNYLAGSSYFGFLPQKREGWILGLSTSGIYRINAFTSISLEYRFTDYPKEQSKHELKLEFKAEL